MKRQNKPIKATSKPIDVRPLHLREIPLKTRKGLKKLNKAIILPEGFTGRQLKLYKGLK
jgi:hypothetical protein